MKATNSTPDSINSAIKPEPTGSLEKLPFSFASFTFHLKAEDRIELPEYKGSTFRGGLGHALKQVWCLRPSQRFCEKNCRMPKQCAYSYIFETPKAWGPHSELHANNLPHPFVLLPPLNEQRIFEVGEALSFQLTLFGSAIQLVESFVVAFDKLGEIGIGKGQGRFLLAKVTNADGSIVYSSDSEPGSGQVVVRNFEEFVEAAEQYRGHALNLSFLTPTHLLHHGRLSEPSFDIFLRRLLARASELAKIHCGQLWNLDYHHLIDSAIATVRTVEKRLEWQDWERYSNRQQQRMKFRGFVGTVTYQGQIQPFLSLIMLGQHLHIGNKTAFGMGKFEIQWQ